MNEYHKKTIWVCLVISVIIAYGFIVDANEAKSRQNLNETLGRVLETNFNLKYNMIDAQIDSPSVIITLTSYRDFDDKVTELNADLIYRSPNIYFLINNGGILSLHTYYVFNDEMTIAWKYTPYLSYEPLVGLLGIKEYVWGNP